MRYQPSVHVSALASPVAWEEHVWRGKDWGMMMEVPLLSGGFAVGCSHPNPQAAGAHWEHAGNMASPAQGWEPELLSMLQGSCRQGL